MSLAHYFGMTRVINLPERMDRRQEVTTMLEQFEMPLGWEGVELFPAVRCDEPRGFPTSAVRGCFLSHLQVLRGAYESGAERVLVMEDDLAISPDLAQCWSRIVEALTRQPWDFLYLGYNEGDLRTPSPNDLIVPCMDSLGTTHFYGVHGRVLSRLIRFLERLQERPFGHAQGGPMHYDGALSTFRAQNPDVRCLRVQPCMGTQRSSRSDISVRWFERVRGLRELSIQARKLKSSCRQKAAPTLSTSGSNT